MTSHISTKCFHVTGRKPFWLKRLIYYDLRKNHFTCKLNSKFSIKHIIQQHNSDKGKSKKYIILIMPEYGKGHNRQSFMGLHKMHAREYWRHDKNSTVISSVSRVIYTSKVITSIFAHKIHPPKVRLLSHSGVIGGGGSHGPSRKWRNNI